MIYVSDLIINTVRSQHPEEEVYRISIGSHADWVGGVRNAR